MPWFRACIAGVSGLLTLAINSLRAFIAKIADCIAANLLDWNGNSWAVRAVLHQAQRYSTFSVSICG
jgi:hypothetical protein